MSILHPLRRGFQNSRILVSVTWILSFTVSIPEVFYVKYEIPDGESLYQCYKESRQMKSNTEMVQDLTILMIQYVAPVMMMIYSYTMIAITIWKNQEISQVVEAWTNLILLELNHRI